MNSGPYKPEETPESKAMRAAIEQHLDEECLPPQAPTPIPDHSLLQCIGRGAYGDVWLARSTLGALRAVKIVYRSRFKEERPYEREFNGILKYEPISRTHEGLVQVLHVGRNEEARCFYYVMELADDVGTKIPRPPSPSPASESPPAAQKNSLPAGIQVNAPYSPRTLHSELASRLRMPPVEAAQIGSRLAGALAHLHSHELVHRDIKPSNVIFVDGQPKLADIGLVTNFGSSQSFVGTEGFIPPEGPGTPSADLYGLGKVLYELATGCDRMEFPQLPPGWMRWADREAFLELNEVTTRACAPEPQQRYRGATELQAELNLFLAGRSLRRARTIERTLARLKRVSVAASVALFLAAGALWFFRNEERHANERANQATEQARLEAQSRAKEAELRQRAESAERASQHQLYTALLEQARATVRSGEMGQRIRAMDALRRAGAISNSAALRREVFAALALPDLRFERELSLGASATFGQLDPAFERVAVGRGKGPVEIRALSDYRLVATLPASTNLQTFHREWSADGRFLAIKRDYSGSGLHADWEIWNTTMARRILLLQDVSYAAVSFHPRLPRLLVHRPAEGVLLWDLEEGRLLARFPHVGAPLILRFSPDGGRFAAVTKSPAGALLSLHDATNPNAAELFSHPLTDPLSAVVWHPDGRSLVVPDHDGTVYWLDTRNGKTEVLGRHKWQAVRAVFSPDGAYLFTGGWEKDLICWEAGTKRRAFTVSLNSDNIQFCSDGKRCAVLTQEGVQVHAFERPINYREFSEPLGGALRRARISPDGRWLAASASKRAGIWDLSGTGPAAIEEEAYDTSFYFTPDGREMLGSRNTEGDVAGFRWQLIAATNPAAPPQLQRLPLAKPPDMTSLGLASNAVVMVSARGTQLLGFTNLANLGDPWAGTIPGLNGVSPDGRWLGIYRPFGTSLHIYHLPGLEPVAQLTHPANFGDFKFSPTGDEVAITSSRAGTEIWDTTTWQRTRALTNFIRVLYAPDGRGLWFTQDQRTAGLYDARTLEPRLLLPTGMLPLGLASDGRKMVVSIDAQRLQLWDLSALREQLRGLGLDWEDSGR